MFILGLEGVVEGGSTDAGGKSSSAGTENCSDTATAGRLWLLVVMNDCSRLLETTGWRLVHGLLRVSAGVATTRVRHWSPRESLGGLNRIASVRLNWRESSAETSGRNIVTMRTVSITGNDST